MEPIHFIYFVIFYITLDDFWISPNDFFSLVPLHSKWNGGSREAGYSRVWREQLNEQKPCKEARLQSWGPPARAPTGQEHVIKSWESPAKRVHTIDLKQIDRQRFLPQSWLICGPQRITIQDTQSKGEPRASPRKERRAMPFYGLGRGCCKGRVRWRKLTVGSMVTFHWLSYGSLPLAEVLGAGRNLFFSCWGCKISLPLWNARSLPFCWDGKGAWSDTCVGTLSCIAEDELWEARYPCVLPAVGRIPASATSARCGRSTNSH